jgi:hypothetical protein
MRGQLKEPGLLYLDGSVGDNIFVCRFSFVISPASKLQLDLSYLNTICEVDVTIQTERWYHAAITGGVDNNLKIWLNGLDTKTSCYKDVSAT